MKIVCSRDELLNGVNTVSKAVPSNTTMSILNCILIDASSDRIKFSANDGDLGIETIVNGNIVSKGIIAIDARMFSDVVRKLPNVDVEIESNKDYSVNIKCGKLVLDINGENGDSFTYMPEVEKNEAIVISQLTLKDIVRQTIFSIGNSDTNKIMSGIHMLINCDKLKCSSLDGHRISIRNVELKNNYNPTEAIIPGKALNEISKIVNGGADDDTFIYVTKSFILFEFGETKVVSRLIEGNYFDVNKMISPDYETKININKKDLYDCIDRSMLFSKEGNKKPIVINVDNNTLSLSVNSTQGSMNDEIEVEMSGRPIEIGFNPKFLLDALKVIDDETINIYFVNAKAPCYIKDENESYIYLVLPINLNNYN